MSTKNDSTAKLCDTSIIKGTDFINWRVLWTISSEGLFALGWTFQWGCSMLKIPQEACQCNDLHAEDLSLQYEEKENTRMIYTRWILMQVNHISTHPWLDRYYSLKQVVNLNEILNSARNTVLFIYASTASNTKYTNRKDTMLCKTSSNILQMQHDSRPQTTVGALCMVLEKGEHNEQYFEDK